jgi:hypothetical protein
MFASKQRGTSGVRSRLRSVPTGFTARFVRELKRLSARVIRTKTKNDHLRKDMQSISAVRQAWPEVVMVKMGWIARAVSRNI